MLDLIKCSIGFIAMVAAYAAFVAALMMLAYIPYALIKLYLFW